MSVIITARYPEDIAEKIKDEAVKKDRSVSKQAIYIARQYFQDKEPFDGSPETPDN